MSMTVTQVLVIELDESVRGSLHDILSTTAGDYAVKEVTTEEEGLAYLAAQPPSVHMVVVCSNTDADHHRTAAFFATVIADKPMAVRHQYILLSSNPALIPDALRVHLSQLHAAIQPKPFDLDAFLATVHEAADRLAATPTEPGQRRPRFWQRRDRQVEAVASHEAACVATGDP